MDACRYCQSPVPIGAALCPRCGKPSHQMGLTPVVAPNPRQLLNPNLVACPKCNRLVSPDARACPSCGHDVGAKDRNFTWTILMILIVTAYCIGRFIDMQTHLMLGR